MRLLITLSLIFCVLTGRSQTSTTDSILEKVIIRFEDANGYKFQQKITSVNSRTDGLPNDNLIDCMPGKQVLVVAVFNQKPANLFGRMLVTKRFGKKIAYDEHKFQAPAYEESLGIYYSLLAVAFPTEANKANCSVNLQVFDKAYPANKVWLLVFSQ